MDALAGALKRELLKGEAGGDGVAGGEVESPWTTQDVRLLLEMMDP